jgi:hypothetical protein
MWIRSTPLVTRKKFHLPQRASQGKRGTYGDRVQSPMLQNPATLFRHPDVEGRSSSEKSKRTDYPVKEARRRSFEQIHRPVN